MTLQKTRIVQKMFRSCGLALAAALAVITLLPQPAAAAPCGPVATDYGSASVALAVPGDGTYRLWTHMKVPDTTNTTYQLEVDGQHCFSVGGGSALTPATWTWVDYQAGTPSNKVQLALTQGNHTLKLIGTKPGVRVDKIIAVTDLNCVPSSTGDNCNTPDDTTVPTIDITAPTADSTVSGTTKITANATDNKGVAKVEFYANGSLIGSDTTAPFEADWDTTTTPNNQYTLTAKSYDAAGNFATATTTVLVKNGDIQAPSAPGGVKATANAFNKVTLTWTASTDNVGVAGYVITRNNMPLTQVTGTTYIDTTVSASTSYTYRIFATDAAGNKSSVSSATIATPSASADAQAPTAPTELTPQVTSSSQINLTWKASTDNVGVTGYEVYRALDGGSFAKVATVTTTNFGDAGLTPLTKYRYYVRAIDAAQNASKNSATTAATQTYGKVKTSQLIGTVRDAGGKGIAGAHITFTVDGKRNIYVTDAAGKYDISNIAGGTYLITYSADGYLPDTIIRPITQNARVAQNVTLIKK